MRPVSDFETNEQMPGVCCVQDLQPEGMAGCVVRGSVLNTQSELKPMVELKRDVPIAAALLRLLSAHWSYNKSREYEHRDERHFHGHSPESRGNCTARLNPCFFKTILHWPLRG
jgi:hypothetical protein